MLIVVHICIFALINKKWGQTPEMHALLINYFIFLSICTLFLFYLIELVGYMDILYLALNSLPPGKFFMLFCRLLILFSKPTFKKRPFKNTIRVSNRLDPDQA